MDYVQNENNAIKIKIGEKYSLLASGILNLTEKNFSIKLGNLEFCFEFIIDKDDETTRFTTEPIEEGKSMKFSVFNMSNALLEGFYKPLKIGRWNGRELLVNFSAWTLDAEGGIRTIVYNILAGEVVNV